MKYLIISIIVAILISVFFFMKGDEKIATRIQQVKYPAMAGEEVSEIAVDDRYNNIRVDHNEDPAITLIKKDVEFLQYRIDQLENKIYNQVQHTDNIERICKSASPIVIPIITFIVGWYKKRKKGDTI